MLSTHGIYQNLQYAVKARFLDEIRNAFDLFPIFSDKVIISNKFPYNERVQYGVILNNSSSNQIRLSPDNFLSDLYSAVRIARQTTYPGIAIEWVRENSGHIANLINEDVSNQLGPTQRKFFTSKQILAGPDNLDFADNGGEIFVTINGLPMDNVFSVDGKNKEVILTQATLSSDVIVVQYFARTLVPYGLYFVDFIEDNQFTISPVYIIEKEILINKTLGTETSAQIKNFPLDINSEEIALSYNNNTIINYLTNGIDYNIDYTSGIVTFLNPLIKNYRILINYRYQPLNYLNGPFIINEYQENHTAIPGIVFSVGRRAKKGDQQVIIVSQNREQQAKIYGGHWEMGLEFAVIAKDPLQMAQMADHIVSYLWGERKNILEFEGITLNSVESTGESEEPFVDTTGDLYYETTVSINVMTEWQRFIPYLNYVKINNINIIPDFRTAIKNPIIGFERLT